MRRVLLLFAVLMLPMVGASHESTTDVAWSGIEPGLLATVVGGCPTELRQAALADIDAVNGWLHDQGIALRFDIKLTHTLKTDKVEAALVDDSAEPMLQEIRRQQADVVIACAPHELMREQEGDKVLGMTLKYVFGGRATAALVVLPSDGTATVDGCTKAVATGPQAFSNTVRHELLHAAGLGKHASNPTELFAAAADLSSADCKVADEARRTPSNATWARVDALWPPSGAASAAAATHDAANGRGPDGSGGPLGFVGLTPFQGWLVIAAAGIVAFGGVLIYVWVRMFTRPAPQRAAGVGQS